MRWDESEVTMLDRFIVEKNGGHCCRLPFNIDRSGWEFGTPIQGFNQETTLMVGNALENHHAGVDDMPNIVMHVSGKGTVLWSVSPDSRPVSLLETMCGVAGSGVRG